MLGKKLRSECERIVQVVEARIEKFMPIEGGEEPLEGPDGVRSVLLGVLGEKTVTIEITVQPGLHDEFWRA